ncbi:hypothetical protein SeMB42_g00034 [Synchytrium endobioticum]|uniref:ABC1 atypical kinase-like domain-containing protein n=1 Tax=Synchytrium endobioticum TaxID=286115 RepID=A0A507DU22_9FUNG|nr:hypothetical protein SeMB42_g00034 [Synchytrium endobioticum]
MAHQSKRAGDVLVMMLASRMVINHVAAQSVVRMTNYARTSSIPKAVAGLYRAVLHAPGHTPPSIDALANQPVQPVPPPPLPTTGTENVNADISDGTSAVRDLAPRSISTHSVDGPNIMSNPTTTTPPKLQLRGSLLKASLTPVAAVDDTICTDAQVATLLKAPMKQSRVPSSRIERLFNYSGIAAGVGLGMVSEAMKRAVGASTSAGGSLVLSAENVERIVAGLSRMRGAALKLGQMLSIQDNKMMPAEVEALMQSVQNSANYMPDSQLETVMKRELGENWLSKFSHFDRIPIAAASIGQVHRAILPSGTPVAVKVQYPGVARSINSDLATLRSLVLLGGLLPKGLYLDNTIRVARIELGWECDYQREAANSTRMRNLLIGDKGYSVPKVMDDLTTSQVLTTEFVEGVPIGETGKLSQGVRDRIGERLLRLCLRELFAFRFMQTDPNWSNFLYNDKEDRIYLIDFGSAREFSKEFTDKYMHVLSAAAQGDRDGVVHWSRELGFLTGLESQAMTMAHVSSVMALATPFLSTSPSPFNFANTDLTNRVRSFIPTMLRERLTPPPDETYSLHRKLSGAWLLCAKLGASVRVRDIWEEVRERYTV